MVSRKRYGRCVSVLGAAILLFAAFPSSNPFRLPALRADEVSLLRAWIDQDAEWSEGVSFASPKAGRPR